MLEQISVSAQEAVELYELVEEATETLSKFEQVPGVSFSKSPVTTSKKPQSQDSSAETLSPARLDSPSRLETAQLDVNLLRMLSSLKLRPGDLLPGGKRERGLTPNKFCGHIPKPSPRPVRAKRPIDSTALSPQHRKFLQDLREMHKLYSKTAPQDESDSLSDTDGSPERVGQNLPLHTDILKIHIARPAN